MSPGLDAAGKLEPGHGSLDLFGYLDREGAGGALEYKHHILEGMSAFARGFVEKRFDGTPIDYGALAGLRWRF